MSNLKTERTTVKRIPARGAYELEDIYSVLDASFICQIGIQEGEYPVIIPTAYGRDKEFIYIHGASSSRLIRQLEKGSPLCMNVTILDGLVLARSVFHHSMNYRSVVLFGQAEKVPDDQKIEKLKIITEHIIKGRWVESRLPNSKELKATTVLKIPIAEASVKTRTGPPGDDEEDYKLDIWAGVLPIRSHYLEPVPDPLRKKDEKLPPSILNSVNYG